MTCEICGEETTGSVGAAGIRWPNICQRCKDTEDERLEANLAYFGELITEALEPIMACLDHTCKDCRHEWFDNNPSHVCPRCGSTDSVTSFDEQEDCDERDEYHGDD